ncbi:Hypothetical protein I595_836 [Croceitalea dokdonensis DOKDO 023]|uniref:DUF2061 domain-containing protein n=1 Tax=Croceitalea dokdonensis DOKDO 023 TaxID=1300341 RepID=A0A0N8H454_9FLAO|nr:DUF2061 domain-containing protein [Croceitalea dokdonensis]KPM32420.1 Hypothetical protein I595_836 [Croceitalea dokdonensis DOKDO 023]
MVTEQLIVTSERGKTTYSKDKASESPKRSIAKSISWRVIGTLDTIIISWIVTGTLSLAFSIGFIELVTKMMLYFFHERIWNTISWGK